MPESYISDAMRAAIGLPVERKRSFPIGANEIRRWALAVYYPDEPPNEYIEAADTTPAPEEFNPFAWRCASREFRGTQPAVGDINAIEISLGIPHPGLNFQVLGGLDVEYGERMHVGDVIECTSRVTGYHEREGRLGLMLFTKLTEDWINQRDETVKRRTLTLIRYK